MEGTATAIPLTPGDENKEGDLPLEPQGMEAPMTPTEPAGVEPAGEPTLDLDQEPDGDATSELEELKKYKEDNTRANETLLEIFDQFPEILGMMKDLARGADLKVAIARHFDPDDLKPMEGDPDYQEWEKASQERKKTRAEREQFSQRMSENIEFSRVEMEAFKQENNLSEQQAQGFFDTVNELLDQIFEGRVDRKFLSTILKASTADQQIETARKQGETKALNTKIEAIKDDTSKKAGDGLPNLNKGVKSGESTEKAPVKSDPFAEAFDRSRTRQRF